MPPSSGWLTVSSGCRRDARKTCIFCRSVRSVWMIVATKGGKRGYHYPVPVGAEISNNCSLFSSYRHFRGAGCTLFQGLYNLLLKIETACTKCGWLSVDTASHGWRFEPSLMLLWDPPLPQIPFCSGTSHKVFHSRLSIAGKRVFDIVLSREASKRVRKLTIMKMWAFTN